MGEIQNLNRLVVVVDADAIIAQENLEDLNHQRSLEIGQKLNSINAQLLYPVTAIVEGVTFIQRPLGSGASAYATAIKFNRPDVEIVPINPNIYSKAVNNFFSPRTSKKNTLFDCLVAATAQEYGAEYIFSFDKFYKKLGFKLAADL